MKHPILSYENAIKLAERNITILHEWHYDTNGELIYKREGTLSIPAPAQSIVQKYLRDSLNTSVEPYAAWQNEKRIGYSVSIALANNDNVFVEDSNDCSKVFSTYEEALEVGITEAFKYLF